MNENINQAAFDILNVFEDVLSKHNIIIPSEDREGDKSEACLYGSEYYAAEDEIKDILAKLVFDTVTELKNKKDN